MMSSFRSDPDAVAGKRIERALIRRVLRLASPYRKLLGGFFFGVVGAAVVTAIPPLLLKSLLDSAVPRQDRRMVAVLAAGAVGLAVASAFLSLLQRYYSAKIGEGLIYDMRVQLFDHVQRLPISFFTRTQTGSLLSRLNNDVIGAQQAVTNTLGTVISNAIMLVVTLSFMLALEWRLTLLTLLVLPAFIFPARHVGRRLQAAADVAGGEDERGEHEQCEEGEPPLEGEHERERHHQHDRVRDHGAESVGDRLLGADHVVVEAREQRPRLRAGEERDRQPLHVVEELDPHVVDEALADLRRV